MNAEHLGTYVGELREFSASHGVAYGSPEDLQGLLAALEARGTFSEECTSMLRSVVYREQGEADATVLLTLLRCAWGGAAEPDGGSPQDETVVRLRGFVCGAMRAPQIGMSEPVGEDRLSEGSTSEPVRRITAGEAESFASIAEEHTAAATLLEVDRCAESARQALSRIETALGELEARSFEVRLYRELLQQRETRLAAGVSGEVQPAQETMQADSPVAGRVSGEASVKRQNAFAEGFDPWDESSDLQKELRRFARQRERALAREAEKASLPLHARLMGGAESALDQLLGRSNPLRRGLGPRAH